MGMFTNALMLYLCLAIALSCAAPTVVFGDGGNSPAQKTFLSWFNNGNSIYDGSGTNGEGLSISSTKLSRDLGNATSDFSKPKDIGSNLRMTFIDPIFQIMSWIGLIFIVLGTPIALLSGGLVGAPPILVVILGIPLVFMMLIGIIAFFRSGQI
jgi:hypothetical protein